MGDLSTNSIYFAIESLEREIEFRKNSGGLGNWDRARDLEHSLREARQEYRTLAEALPRLRDLKAAADREYDRHVTRFVPDEPEGCSCHINPPCSFCTREADEPSSAGDL